MTKEEIRREARKIFISAHVKLPDNYILIPSGKGNLGIYNNGKTAVVTNDGIIIGQTLFPELNAEQRNSKKQLRQFFRQVAEDLKEKKPDILDNLILELKKENISLKILKLDDYKCIRYELSYLNDTKLVNFGYPSICKLYEYDIEKEDLMFKAIELELKEQALKFSKELKEKQIKTEIKELILSIKKEIVNKLNIKISEKTPDTQVVFNILSPDVIIINKKYKGHIHNFFYFDSVFPFTGSFFYDEKTKIIKDNIKFKDFNTKKEFDKILDEKATELLEELKKIEIKVDAKTSILKSRKTFLNKVLKNNIEKLVLFGDSKKINYSEKNSNKRVYTYLNDEYFYLDGDLFFLKNKIGTYEIIEDFKSDKIKVLYNFFLSTEFKNLEDYYKDLIETLNLDVKFISGSGLIDGFVTVSIGMKPSFPKKEYTIVITPFKKSFSLWKKDLKKELKEKKEDLLKSIEREKEAVFIKYQNYCNNALVRDILRYITMNEECITKRVIVNGLRNVSYDIKAVINHPKNARKYNDYKENEIIDIIDKLCRDGVIQEIYRKRIYREYILLKPCNDAKYIIANYDCDKNDLKKKIKANKDFSIKLNDSETECLILEILSKDSLNLKNYISLIQYIENKNIRCLYKEKLLNAFKECPIEIIELIKMKVKSEEDKSLLKFYKEILKNIKNKQNG